MERNCTVYFAKNAADAMFHLKNTSNLQVCGACTQLSTLPESTLIIRNIEEFRYIERRERYIEFGSAVTLSQLLELGEKRLPTILYEALRSTANPLVRNVATVGGNICAKGIKHTLFAPFLAVDARLELRSPVETKTIPMSQFNHVPSGFLLSKIRYNLDEWDVSVFRRLGPMYSIDDTSASFVFLARTQKNVLSDLRVAFCGSVRFRSRDVENILIGGKLPLSERDIQVMLESAAEAFDSTSICDQNNQKKDVTSSVMRSRFLNLLKYSLEQLT